MGRQRLSLIMLLTTVVCQHKTFGICYPRWRYLTVMLFWPEGGQAEPCSCCWGTLPAMVCQPRLAQCHWQKFFTALLRKVLDSAIMRVRLILKCTMYCRLGISVVLFWLR